MTQTTSFISLIFLLVNMKLVLILLFIPSVFGDCPTIPENLNDCSSPNLLCGGEEDEDGCPTAQWCLEVDPYAKCSARAFCPTICPSDMTRCSGGRDQDGCRLPDTCISMENLDNPDCPAYCPLACNLKNEIACPGGIDLQGCSLQGECIRINPDVPTFCPANCNENEKFCRGGRDSERNPLPDSCVAIEEGSSCTPLCPSQTSCDGQDDKYCPGPVDRKGCETQGYCITTDLTEICQENCAINCPKGELNCYMGVDDMGCY